MAKVPGTNQNTVGKLYQTVIDDVINNIREAFLDDGVDEQVLQELKHTWESKVEQSKAVENTDQQRGLQSTMPRYVNAQPMIYRAMPAEAIARQGLQMTAAGHQATLALPSSVVYQQKLPMASSTQAPIYTAYQPAHQITHQPNTQPVIVTSQRPERQVDGASDPMPCCSKSKTNTKLSNLEIPCTITLTQKQRKHLPQLDGRVDSSSDEDDTDDDDDDDEDDEEENEERESPVVVDEEPLCSDDDGTDEDPVELFDTDNVIVCQYDKIHRTKCRWKFNLKVGIMNLNGKDYVFQKATGEAEW